MEDIRIKIEIKMSKHTEFKTWPYNFTFSENGITIENALTVKAIWSNRKNPDHDYSCSYKYELEWGGKGLCDMMGTESNTYPPYNLHGMLEHIWCEWRRGNIMREEVEARVDEIKTYIDACTDAKPSDDFWSQYL